MMPDGSKPATINLNGCFRIETADGREVPVKSAKGQGLLALLATNPKGERSRQWLQAKLWSDRSPDQASGSLRQELAQLHKVLDPAGIGLAADRQRVWLDLRTVAVLSGRGDEFLEGLDVRDSEFDLWLVTQRMHQVDTPRATPAPVVPDAWTIAITPSDSASGQSRWVERLFADALVRTLREMFSASVIVGPVPKADGRLSVVEVQCFAPLPDTVELRVSLNHPTAGRQVWSGHRVLALDGTPVADRVETLSLVSDLIDALDDVLAPRSDTMPDDPDQLCRAAVRAMFSMQRHKLIEADSMLARAFDLAPRGTYLAWRAQIKAIQKVEKHASDHQALREEARQLIAQAIELEPNNSVVLAALANTHGQLLAEDARSLVLAERSVRLNPANPMAWWALSSASVYTSRPERAYDCAVRGRRLSALSPHRFWWNNQQFGASLVLGRLEEALHFCELAHAENPGFRPPLRYLIGLYAHNKRFGEAMDASLRLKDIEPDFEVVQLLKDKSYPASLLHRAPGLDIDQVRAVM